MLLQAHDTRHDDEPRVSRGGRRDGDAGGRRGGADREAAGEAAAAPYAAPEAPDAGDGRATGLGAARAWILLLAALAAGAAVAALQLESGHQDARAVWALFAPAVGWSFVGAGLYAWRRRPANRTGALMVRLGFAWFVFALDAANAPLVYTLALVAGGTWGGTFLHLGLAFPTGRLETRLDRVLTTTGYLVFPLAFVPALLVSGPAELACDRCPANLLLVRRDADLAHALTAVGATLYAALFTVVLVRSVRRWRAAPAAERVQLAPVYTCALLTFLLVIVARSGAGQAAWWAAFVATGVTPFAFLGGLLRSHVSRLDAELRERLAELRASRARLVEAGDTARRRLERDLHDGAQARLVALGLLLGRARVRAADDPALEALLADAVAELHTSLDELRELARGIHPAVLSDRGLEAALRSLAGRAPVPVTLAAPAGRFPEAVESAAYFVASEGIANVAKYSHATRVSVTVREAGGTLRVDVADDGIGGADAARGSGLRGLADRLAALDGTLAVDSPAGRGTRLRAEIPCPRANARPTPGAGGQV